MEYGYSILMFAFAGLILIYAGLIAMGNYQLIRRLYSAKIKDKKEYAKGVARTLALTALAPFLSGIVGLVVDEEHMLLPAGIVLIAGFAVFIAIGTKMMKK